MNSVTLPSLTLLVTNAQHLESGLSAQHTWTSSGGVIGSRRMRSGVWSMRKAV